MSIDGLLNQTITIYGTASRDGYGRLSFGAGTSVDARFSATKKRVLLPSGDQMTIEAIAHVPAGTTVNENDKVTYDSQDYKVFSRYAVPDGEGNTHHIKLELIQWQE